MDERITKVTLLAQVSNYTAGMEQVRKANTAAALSSDDAKAKFEAQNQAMTQVGSGLVAIGALAMVGLGLAVKKFADFDQAMSNVAAATHESEQNMNALRDAALDAGAKTVFTATEAANAIEELGKAGLSTKDILEGGLSGALDLASAGGLGVADAAGIAAVALKTFKLEGGDMAHVADILSAGAGKAMGSVTDLSQALSQSGQVASSTGLSIEETTATLSAFASQGLLGSDAGTSFKAMLQRLTPQSAEAAKKMSELGISAYDAQGNFIGMEKFAGNLQDSLKGLTTEQRNSALATIFGSDAVRAATVLYAEGESGIKGWIGKVNDSGYAAETAALRMDNLKGDVEKLGGAFDTALIKSGEAADIVLRFLTQTATNLVDAFNNATPIVQGSALAIGGLTAAVALGTGTVMLAIPKYLEYRTAIETLGPTAQKTATALGTMGRAFGVLATAATAAAVIDIFAKSLAEGIVRPMEDVTNAAKNSATVVDDFKNALETSYGEGFDSSLANTKKMLAGLGGALKDAEANQKDFLNPVDPYNNEILGVINKLGKTYGELASTDLPAAQSAFRALVAQTDGSVESQMALLNQMPDLKSALMGQATELGILGTGTDEAANNTQLLKLAFGNATPTALEAADAYLAAADEAKGLDSKLSDLIDQINKANGIGQDAITTNVAYQRAIADADLAVQNALAGVEGFGLGLDETTRFGQDNNDMLVDLAGKSQEAAKAQYDLDGNTANYKATLEAGHQAIYDRALALTGNADAAQLLADKIYAIPPEADFTMMSNTQSEIDKLNILKATMEELAYGQLGIATSAAMYDRRDGAMIRRAMGGILPGAPSSKDNMFIHAASGEFVVNARQTANPANRRALEYINAGGVITGYANGGLVQPQYASSFGTSGGGSYSSTGDTFNASFAVLPVPGQPVEEQLFNAARRLKSRQKVKR